jgi:hypothetical protein
MSGSRRDRGIDLAVAALLGFLVLGPMLLQRGFALRGDMVLVPHQPWKDAWLALDGSAPRFVPGDALLSAATSVVPGDLLQKALLLGVFLLAGTGAGLMVRHHGAVARSAAIVLVCWNPWVAERLLIGQWGLVVGYAALPWVVLAAAAVRDDVRRGWPLLVCGLAFTSLWSPPAALLGSLTALCVVVVRPRRSSLAMWAGASVLVNLPWVVPSLLAADRVTATGAQFDAFAARGESSAGLVPSVLSLGGIWKSSAVPDERTLAPVVVLSCLTVALAVWGWRSERVDSSSHRVRVGAGLSLLALVCLGLAVVPAIPPVTQALDTMTDSVPALGILRDSHRFLGPAVLALLPGVSAATAWLWARRPRAEAVRALAVLAALWPVLCLPSMAWGLRGSIDPVVYPTEWFTVQRVMADVEGATVVLPWRGGYRGYAWNDRRAMLDPAPRFFAGDVLIDDRLLLGDIVLDNEDPRLADVTRALDGADPAAGLRRLGVTHVLVEKGNGVTAEEVPAGNVVHRGRGLLLVELDGEVGSATYSAPSRGAVVAADIAAAIVVLVALACVSRRRVYGALAYDSGRGST